MAHEFKCCICGQKVSGRGNNPWPVKASGECCLVCDMGVVVPARIRLSETRNNKNYENNDSTTEAMAERPMAGSQTCAS